MGAKRSTPAAPALHVAAGGEPAGRLLQLIAETNLPQPYVVSASIVIKPLTKATREKLNTARSKRMIASYALSQALRISGDDAPNDTELAELANLVNDADEEYHQLFFGDQHAAVMAFFSERDPALWDAFCADIQRQFLPSALPAGQCPHCGNVIDAEALGKPPASST